MGSNITKYSQGRFYITKYSHGRIYITKTLYLNAVDTFLNLRATIV